MEPSTFACAASTISSASASASATSTSTSTSASASASASASTSTSGSGSASASASTSIMSTSHTVTSPIASSNTSISLATATTANTTCKRLSKAEKRALKTELMKGRRQMWRQREREKHKQKVHQRHVERESKLAAMTPEERASFEAKVKEERDRLYHECCKQTARVQSAFEGGLRVAIDLSYGHMMTHKEQASLSRQLSRCWGINRRASAPVSLHFTALDSCPPACLPKDNDHHIWKVHCVGAEVADHFSRDELVFLSPDADSVLLELDKSKVYVIGGLVDSSVQKATSLRRADGLGVASARLPLNEFGTVVHQRLPLTLPAVLEILVGVNHDKDWVKAIETAVPLRQAKRSEVVPRRQRRALTRAGIAKTWERSSAKSRTGGTGGNQGDDKEDDEGEEESNLSDESDEGSSDVHDQAVEIDE